MHIRIAEIEEAFKEVFKEEEGVVTAIETVYEKSKDGDYLKLVICIQGLSTEDISIIHTKFIFKTDLEKDSTHLDIKLHSEKGKEITDAKFTAQVQLPGGRNQVLAVPYSAEEKYYVAKLLTTATGDYQVVLQADVKGEKFNSRFSFKR